MRLQIFKNKYPLIINTLIVLGGSLTAQGLNFISLVFLARYFGPDEIALYTTSLVLLTLLLSIADSGLSNSIVNLVNRHNNNQKEMYLFLKVGLFIRIILGISLMVSGFFLVDYLAISLYSNEELKILFIYSFIGVLVLTLHSYVSTIFQAESKFIHRSKFQIITSIIRLLGLFILFSFPSFFTIKSAFIVYVFSPLLILMFHISTLIKIFKFNINFKDFLEKGKQIFSYSKWLFLSMIAVLLLSRLDQFMLLKMTSIEEVGYYAIALQLIMILPLLTESLTTVLLPRISNIETDIEQYRKDILKKIAPLSCLLLLLIPFSEYAVTLIFGEEYKPAVGIFQILLVGFSLELTINLLSLIFYSTSKVWMLTIMNYFQLLLVIGTNIALIPQFGAMGSAFGTVLVRIVALIYVYIFSRKISKSIITQGDL